MKWTIISSIFFLVLLLVTVQVVVVSASSDIFIPDWMKESAFAEYTNQSPFLVFLNGSYFEAKGKTGDPAVFRWTCIEQNETIAKLQLQLDFGESADGVHLTGVIFVDMTSKSVYLTNGTLLGTTRFWCLSNPSQDDKPIFWDFPPEKIVATLDCGNYSAPLFYNTIQGIQKFYFLNANGTIRGESYIALPSAYDFDTGIGLAVPYVNDPMLLALGIKEVVGSAQLTITNIELGPREIWFDIYAALPFVAVFVAFLLVFLAVYLRLRKRRH